MTDFFLEKDYIMNHVLISKFVLKEIIKGMSNLVPTVQDEIPQENCNTYHKLIHNYRKCLVVVGGLLCNLNRFMFWESFWTRSLEDMNRISGHMMKHSKIKMQHLGKE